MTRIVVTSVTLPLANVESKFSETRPRREGTAVAIVEFMLGALLDNPQRLGGRLQPELAGMRSARRGVYRIIYEIDEPQRVVIVHRIDHRTTAYRPR